METTKFNTKSGMKQRWRVFLQQDQKNPKILAGTVLLCGHVYSTFYNPTSNQGGLNIILESSYTGDNWSGDICQGTICPGDICSDDIFFLPQ